MKVAKNPNYESWMRPSCAICGKFCRIENMEHQYTPDSAYSSEESYWECFKCIKKSDAGFRPVEKDEK